MSKIVLITHMKGGSGKSTICYNVAQNLCKTSKLIILDMDPQGSLAQLSDIVKDFTITTDKSILKCANDLDFIFIDTPPFLSNELRGLIRVADIILIPTKAGVLDLMAIDATINLIKKEEKLSKTMIVFNMIKPKTTLTRDIEQGLKLYNLKIAKSHLSDLVSFTRSFLLNGVKQNSKAQNQIDNLTKELLMALIQ